MPLIARPGRRAGRLRDRPVAHSDPLFPRHKDQASTYATHVTIDADAEYERVRTRYAPARPRDLVFWALAIGVLCVASIFRQIDWAFALGGIVGFAAWEFIKFRLRRNARNSAQAAR